MAFTITTAAVSVTRSGTSFTIDVSAANLSENLLVKDFLVLDQTNEVTLSNTNFTKTSQTVLTYSGPDIGTDINLEVRRNTPVERFQIQQFGNKFDSAVYNEELDRVLGRIFEITIFGAGATEFFIPTPQNQAYGVAWATDQVRGRTANVLYDELETCARIDENETITGDWAVRGDWTFDDVAPATSQVTMGIQSNFVVDGNMDVNSASADFTGTTSMTRNTPATATNNTEIATTNFVRAAIDEYVDTKLVGTRAFWGPNPPSNWLLCNGATFSSSQYPKLFAHLGSTTLPNHLGRFVIAADGGTYPNGGVGGTADSTVVTHSHTITDPGHQHTGGIGGSLYQTGGASFSLQRNAGSGDDVSGTTTVTTGVAVNSTGSSGIGANNPPYVALQLCIYAGTSQS